MIKTYCDMCGKLLKENLSDQVNIDFNSYTELNHEYQLCIGCSKEVDVFIKGRKKENKGNAMDEVIK